MVQVADLEMYAASLPDSLWLHCPLLVITEIGSASEVQRTLYIV